MKGWILLMIGMCGAKVQHPPDTVVNNVLNKWDNDFEEYVDKSLQAGRKRQGIVLYSSKCSGEKCKSNKTGCTDSFCKSKVDKFSQGYDVLD